MFTLDLSPMATSGTQAKLDANKENRCSSIEVQGAILKNAPEGNPFLQDVRQRHFERVTNEQFYLLHEKINQILIYVAGNHVAGNHVAGNQDKEYEKCIMEEKQRLQEEFEQKLQERLNEELLKQKRECQEQKSAQSAPVDIKRSHSFSDKENEMSGVSSASPEGSPNRVSSGSLPSTPQTPLRSPYG